MLYQKQKSNPRSPLTVIRNHIKNNLQTTSSRSISRSPSCSPASQNLKSSSKDYSTYIPVRSLSKVENVKPTSATQNHNELRSKRKLLVNESKKLEEKVREIKRKVENEVKKSKLSTRRIPRSHCSLVCQKLRKILIGSIKINMKFGWNQIVKKAKSVKEVEVEVVKRYQKKILAKAFVGFVKEFRPRVADRMSMIEIANRHYKLQLIVSSMTKWQEFANMQKLRPEDRSYIEEMDSLLDSFIQDSQTISLEPSLNVTPTRFVLYDNPPPYKDNSPNLSRIIIPEKLDFDSSNLFSFREIEVSELDLIAMQHYQNASVHFRGILPWKKFLKIKQESRRKADRFRMEKLKSKGIHGFLVNFVKANSDPYREIVRNFRKWTLLPRFIHAWSDYVKLQALKKINTF